MSNENQSYQIMPNTLKSITCYKSYTWLLYDGNHCSQRSPNDPQAALLKKTVCLSADNFLTRQFQINLLIKINKYVLTKKKRFIWQPIFTYIYACTSFFFCYKTIKKIQYIHNNMFYGSYLVQWLTKMKKVKLYYCFCCIYQIISVNHCH